MLKKSYLMTLSIIKKFRSNIIEESSTIYTKTTFGTKCICLKLSQQTLNKIASYFM